MLLLPDNCCQYNNGRKNINDFHFMQIHYIPDPGTIQMTVFFNFQAFFGEKTAPDSAPEIRMLSLDFPAKFSARLLICNKRVY
jgi:hypothetical protein